MARKGELSGSESREEDLERGQPCSPHEVERIVADDFEMLRAELAGEPYSKADHNRALRSRLSDRSKSSVEYKHQNLSAVPIGMGLPDIDGYKPARNIQKTLLPQAVDRVFDFGRTPRIDVISGALPQEIRLEPVEYRASLSGRELPMIMDEADSSGSIRGFR